jgi:hypothetical protein
MQGYTFPGLVRILGLKDKSDALKATLSCPPRLLINL